MNEQDDDIDIDISESALEGVERRQVPRVGMRLGVRFASPFELAEAIRATTANIGLGGLCLRTRKAYEKDTPLDLVIELGDGESLSVSATVAWSRPGAAVGVRFDSLTDAQKARLAELLCLPPGEDGIDLEI